MENIASNGNLPPNPNIPVGRTPGKPPPASSRALQNLTVVQVTADDVLEESNKECLICLEMNVIGGMACKLECGHLYHRECAMKWLAKHCTCKSTI